MNLPDWLSLSATSGTGSGKITATVDKCTARAARRTTEFSVKTDSGSSRRVRVIQNGIAEFVNITNPTGDVAIPDTIPDGYAVVITGTSNSPILTFTVSGSLMLTNTQAIVTDENSNSINFISGSPIDGDPGATAMYSYTLVFKPTSNTTANELKSTFTISSQSGASASVNFTQAAGSGVIASVPRFVNNQAKTVPAEGIAAIANVAVYNPDAIPWDILVVPTPPALVTDITIQEGVESEYITPLTVSVLGNENTESGRQYILYLVPDGATNTAVVYSSMVVNQLAAPVNPYIEGDYEMSSYAGGLVTLRVIDQKNVGWYPEAIFKDATQTEIPSNPCTVLITGTSDKGVSYTDADSGTVFSPEAGNVKIVGDGIVKIHINNSYEDGYSATMNLRVSIDDLVTEPYDYVVVGISNIPQFDFEEYEIVLGPSDASIVDSLLTIGNPNGVPFTISTSENPASRRKATIYAGSNMVYDDTDGIQPVVLTDDILALNVTASERGQFNITLKSQDGATVFDTITLKVYRQPAIKFAVESSQLNPTILHVTEPFVNVATVYKNYANFSPSPSYSESDIMSNVAVTYTIESGEQSAILFEMDSATNAAKVTGFQVLTGEISHLVVIRATYEGSETDFYKEAYAEYAVSVMRTQAYVRIDNFDSGQSYISLYKPATDDLPDTKQVLYTVLVDRYTGFQEKGEPVVYNTIFPEDIIDMIFTSTEATPGGEPYLSINGDVITAAAVPTVEGPAVIPVNISLGYTNHFAQFPTDEYPAAFNVRVQANTHYVLRVQPSTGTWAHTIDYTDGGVTRTEYYLYYEASVDGSGANPYSLTITLTNDITNGQNDVPMNHTIRFRDISGEYTTETGLENVILENDVILVKRTGSDAISTSAQSHQVTVVLKGNAGGSRGASFTIYADVEGVPLENNFTVYVNQRGEQSKSYSLEPDGQEVCSDGRQLYYWLEEIIRDGVPCYEDSHDLPLVIKYNGQVNSGESLPYPLAGQLISAEYTYYVDYGDGQWVTPPEGSPEAAQWLHLEALDGTSNITTDANGKVNARIWWNANSSNEIKRKCEMILTCTLYNPSSNRYAPEPITANLVGEGNGVIQNEYTVTLIVKFFSNDVEVTTRTVANNYTESEPAYTARAYLNGVQIDSSSERLTITYSSSDGAYVTVNPNTGLISNLNVGTARIEADARYCYDIGEELYYEGTGWYDITIERAKTRPEIHKSIPTGLVYRDTNNYEITAWSDSGAEVFITPQPTTQLQDAIVLGARTVVEEDGHMVTKQSFHLLSPSVAEATSTHKRVATDANGINILFTCAAVGDWLDATANGSLVIGKYIDSVTDWGITASNPAWLQYGGGATSRIYTITTASGNAPKSMSASSDSIATNKVVLTWPYNGNSKKVRVVSNAYTVNSGPDTVVLETRLKYDDYNYSLVGIDDGGSYADYRNAYVHLLEIYQYPDSPNAIDRSVSFGRSVYSVPVGATAPTSLVFSPSGATGGTPTYTVVSGENNFSINSSGVITGNTKTSTNGVIRVTVTAANGYSGCTATAEVEVGKASTSISFREQSLSLDAGEIAYVLATLSPAVSGARVNYSASDYSNIISVQRQNDGSCKVTAIAAGSFRIRAYYDGNDNYASSEAYLYGSVDSVIQDCTITLQPTSFELYSGSSMNLSRYVSYTPPDASVSYDITSGGSYISLAGDMVTADSVSSDATAQVKITVEKAGMNKASATASITVKPQSVNTQTVTLSPTLNSIYEVNNDSAQYPYQTDLNPSVNPSGGTIQYSYTPNNNYLTISSLGMVTANQGAGGTNGITYTITARRQLSGYSDGVGTATLTVYPVPTGPTPSTPVDRRDAIIWHPVPTETVSLLMNGVYENLATSQSERAVSFASSNGTKADVISARVNIPSNAGTGTVVLSLTLETSPEVVETCTLAVTTTAADSKNGRQVNWTSKSQTINVNAGDSFILIPKTDTSVASSSRLTIPNGVHTTSEKYTHWDTADSSKAIVSGGVVMPLAKTDSNITIKARVQTYTNTTTNIRWLAASSYYTLSVSKVVPELSFTYTPSSLQGGGTEFYFSRGSVLPSDFNVPVYDSSTHAGYFQWYPSNTNGSSNTGIATLTSSGIVTIGNDIGPVTVTARILAHDIYEATEASYVMNIVSYKVVLTYANGNIIPDGAMLNVGGQGGSVTVRAYYYNTIYGQGDVAYDDTPIIPTYCSAISPNDSLPDPQTGMYRTSNVLAKYHTITFHFDRNMSGEAYETTREIQSNIGGASATVTILRGAGGGGQGDPEHAQYVITRSDSTVTEKNHYWGTGGFDFGQERAIPASYAGTDETYAIDIAQDAAQKLSWQTATGSTQQLWWEVQDWYKSGSDKRIDTSSGRVAIQYEVLISDDGNTWTATSSNSWFWGYLGDGNSQATTADIKLYGTGGFLLNAQNKFYPHIAWTQNASANPRYGKVILYYLQSGDYKMGRVEITFMQQGTNS